MRKKIDLFWYWFIFVVAFVLCFFVINNKNVSAYTLNSEGNLVSDNIFDVGSFTTDTNCGVTLSYDSSHNIFTLNGTVSSNNCVIKDFMRINSNDLQYITLNFYYVSGSTNSIYENNTGLDFNLRFFIRSLNWSYTLGDIRVYNDNYNNNLFSSALNTNFDNSIIYTLDFHTGFNSLYNVSFNNYSFKFMVTNNSDGYLANSSTSFEPFGVWYSQENLEKEKELSYDDGYDKGYNVGYDSGYAANNSIPTIYLDYATVLYQVTNPLNGSIGAMSQDVTSTITNLNATLNFNSFLNMSWGYLVRDNQTFTMDIVTIASIGADDVLTFAFNDISNSSYFTRNFYITFGDYSSCGVPLGDCNSVVSLSYQDIVDSDYEVVLADFKPSLTVSEFNNISIVFYRENGFMYGLTNIVDTSLLSDFDYEYDIGYKVGYINGNVAGLLEGEAIGYDKGYNVGYTKASQVVSNPGNNTLVGLVSAIFGMPVNMLISIYNFEFLGVNLASFILSLVTCIVCIWLIRKFL